MRAFQPFYLTLIIFITACSTTNTANINKDTIINVAAHTRVHKAADNTDAKFNVANNDRNITIYAPNLWKKAVYNMNEMRDIVGKFDADDQGFFGGPSESKVLSYISQTQMSVDKAKQHAKIVSDFLKQPVDDITFITPKINDIWQREFQGINRSLNALIRDLEKNNNLQRHTNSKEKLQARISNLEVKIIIAEVYTPLKRQVETLNDNLIPISYAKTSQALAVLNSQIAASPRDTKVIKILAEKVQQDLLRSQHVSKDVDWINRLSSSQREKAVLHYRNSLEKLSKKLFETDTSTLSFSGQIKELEAMFSSQLVTKKVIIDQALTNDKTRIETVIEPEKMITTEKVEVTNVEPETSVHLTKKTEKNIPTKN